MRSGKRHLALAAALAVMAASPTARAGDRNAEPRRTAQASPAAPNGKAGSAAAPSPEHDAVFKSGLDQYAHGNYVAAIATWEPLLTTMGEGRGFKVLYNLGLAYQQIGDVTKAIERYRAFVKQVGDRTGAPAELVARAEDAAQRAKQLEASHGAVNVLAPKRGGLVLTRFGTGEPRAAGYVVWLAPGSHIIEIHVGTNHVKQVKIDVEPGAAIDIDTTPDEVEAPKPPPAAPVEKRESAVPTLVWVGAGATLVSLALPVTLLLVADGKKSEADKLGPGHSTYGPARDTYQTWRTAYYVSYALPATLGLATVALYLLRPEPPKSSVSVGITPGGVDVSGRF